MIEYLKNIRDNHRDSYNEVMEFFANGGDFEDFDMIDDHICDEIHSDMFTFVDIETRNNGYGGTEKETIIKYNDRLFRIISDLDSYDSFYDGAPTDIESFVQEVEPIEKVITVYVPIKK